MKNKVFYIVISFVVLFIVSIYVTNTTTPQVKPSQELDKFVESVMKKKSGVAPSEPAISIDMAKAAPEAGEVVRSKDGKMVVKGVLPPELSDLNKKLTKINKKLEKAIAQDRPNDGLKDLQQLIQDTDNLILKTNQRLGIPNPVVGNQ